MDEESLPEVNIKLFYTLLRTQTDHETAVERMLEVHNAGFIEHYKELNKGKEPPKEIVERKSDIVATWCFETEQVISEAAEVLGIELPK